MLQRVDLDGEGLQSIFLQCSVPDLFVLHPTEWLLPHHVAWACAPAGISSTASYVKLPAAPGELSIPREKSLLRLVVLPRSLCSRKKQTELPENQPGVTYSPLP